ncbi:MAG: Lrp/AsnC family transcriptional regulator [Hyphomicrobiaceae bacterium]
MDHFDIKLLEALQRDGRLTNSELADLVGLSASQCSRRRAALEEAGIIQGYHAVLAGNRIDITILAYVEVSLNAHSQINSKKFAKLLDGLEEVQEAHALTGESDYLVKVAVTDLRALSRLLNDVFLVHDSVAKVRSSIVLESLKQTSRMPLGHLR